MAGAYAKEFEKWLQGNNDEAEGGDDDSIDDADDFVDEVDNYQLDSMKERDGQAPDLFNNHNGSALNSGKHYFQDEPPILEPVPYGPCTKLSGSAVSSRRGSEMSENDFDDNQAQTDTRMSKIDNFKEKEKTNTESEKYFFNKSKESENIFDKFSILSEGDDFPPPLIPSHEAHLTTVDAKEDDSITEKSYATLQDLSPNFCAMEADSTSEMLKVDDSQSLSKDRGEKMFGSNDIGVECDSTCMLSASPQVVSPGSVSTVYESDNQNLTPCREELLMTPDDNQTLKWNTLSTGETFDSLPLMSKQTREVVEFHHKGNLASDYRGNFRFDSHDSGWDRECPKLEAVMDVNEGKEVEEHHKGNGDVEDPPILSVVPKTLITPSMSVRRKRHTIDTPDSVRRSKDSSSNCSKESKLDYKTHRTISHTKPKVDELSHKNHGHKPSSCKRKDSSSHSHSRNHFRPQKRKRCQTLPIVDLISFGSHLPKDLYSFVVNSSQLYTLQCRMHRLVSLLFPQLSSDLYQMSPDSSRFETLLNDLFHFLKETLDESNTVSKHKSVTHSDHHKDKTDIKKLCSGTFSNDSLDNRIPPYKTLCKNISTEFDEHKIIKTEFDLNESHHYGIKNKVNQDNDCQHSSVSGLSSSFCEDMKSDTNSNQDAVDDFMIPKLSELSLTKDNERVLKCQPSVLIHKNPHAVHKSFFRLSCRTLQLLLPDLDVSLMNELSESPNDLLLFIDSVISSNSC